MNHEFKNSFSQNTVPAKNEVFKQEKNLAELYQFSKEVAEYLQREKISNLVLIDRSARNFYLAVKEYWQAKFPENPEPKYYFFNPDGFKWKGDSEAAAEFAEVYKDLNKAKDQPLLLFDTCIHSGSTLYPITSFLKNNGFTDVRVAAIKSPNTGNAIKADLLVGADILESGSARGCSPFGDGALVTKSAEHIYSAPVQDAEKKQKALQSRKEIKEAMKSYLAKDKEQN